MTELDQNRLAQRNRGCRCPTIPTRPRWHAVEAQLSKYPPLVFAGEARRLKTHLADGGARRGVPAAGRRLRRKLRRVLRRHHPRHLQGDAADGDGADLRRQGAGGQGGPDGRPVRQAALGRRPKSSTASSCPATAATSSTISTSRPRRACPTPQKMLQAYTQAAASLNLLRAFSTGGYADVHQVHSLDARLYRERRGRDATATWPTGFPTRSISCGRRRHSATRRIRCNTVDFYTSHEALLLEYEEALTPDRLHHRPAGGGLGPHALDRRPHPPARRRACGILPAACRTRSG